ncbi:MAG: 3-isopropylmalate dehydratase large subunit [Candidatus Gracilibacteria bacterium]
MPKNIIEKIWDAHVVKSKKGYPDIFAIDLQLMHEVTSPQAFTELRRRKAKVFAPERTVATVDHIISTGNDRKLLTYPAAKKQVETLRENCEEFGIPLYDFDSENQGIVHVIGPELGLTQPGMTIVCGDSHTSTHGAFGSIAFGIGTTEVGHVLMTGCMLQTRPKTMKVEFIGRMPSGISSKDLILKLIQQIGVSGGTGHVIEYTGEAIRKMSMEERMTVCNMSIECGARAGLIAPDKTTFAYIKGRQFAPKNFDLAMKKWKTFVSDKNARYDKVVKVNISKMAPMVTWGINPSQSVEVTQRIPAAKTDSIKQALAYTKLKPSQLVAGVKVDYVFIGSCTNARLPDLRAVAKILKGKKVSTTTKVYIVPGSKKVQQAAIKEGLDKIFIKAGADFRNPGCSMCLAMNEDKVPAGKRCASTSNRNFIGRQGPGSITHLMSPIMAAAAAITGKITDVRKFLKGK